MRDMTSTPTWFAQFAAAVAQLEMLGTVVSAEDLVQTAPCDDTDDLEGIHSWIRSARDFLVEIDVALRAARG